jgi:hypothetical protein
MIRSTVSLLLFTCMSVAAQTPTLYVPTGSPSNVGTSTNSNVGIGTSSPATKLEVNGSISMVRGNRLQFLETVGGANRAFIESDVSNRLLFHVGTGAGLDAMMLAADGNVGIGTAAPASKLEVSDGNQSVRLLTGSNTSWYRLEIGVNDNGVNFSNNSGIRGYNFSNTTGTLMSLMPNGNVGIGTTTPAYRLDVKGDLNLDDGEVNTDLKLRLNTKAAIASFNTVSTPNDVLYINRDWASTPSWHSDFNTVAIYGNVGIGTTTPGLAQHVVGATGWPATSGNTQTGILRLQGTGNNAVLDFSAFGTNGASLQVSSLADLSVEYPLMLNPNGGKVGIGLTTPLEALHVNGSIRGHSSGGALRIKTDHGYVDVGSMNGTWVHFKTDRPNFYFDKPVTVDGAISSYNTNNLILRTGTTSRMTVLNSNGYVGIGTTTPDALLAVSGQIHAEEVVVDLNVPGPDYVFDNDYKLPSLEEIQNYITTNNHLPEVPSAKEMEEKGINVGEMNMVLLKKIEELTLYLIELKSENAELSKRVTNLEK